MRSAFGAAEGLWSIPQVRCLLPSRRRLRSSMGWITGWAGLKLFWASKLAAGMGSLPLTSIMTDLTISTFATEAVSPTGYWCNSRMEQSSTGPGNRALDSSTTALDPFSLTSIMTGIKMPRSHWLQGSSSLKMMERELSLPQTRKAFLLQCHILWQRQTMMKMEISISLPAVTCHELEQIATPL